MKPHNLLKIKHPKNKNKYWQEYVKWRSTRALNTQMLKMSEGFSRRLKFNCNSAVPIFFPASERRCVQLKGVARGGQWGHVPPPCHLFAPP